MPSGVVLVTGATTGIGEATALHLRELGFEPVAGVRRDEDAERLEGRGLRTLLARVLPDRAMDRLIGRALGG
jgi:NAD(P)-dependent dehydrogenase (short-subunit alcohol dehydrogenase family)